MSNPFQATRTRQLSVPPRNTILAWILIVSGLVIAISTFAWGPIFHATYSLVLMLDATIPELSDGFMNIPVDRHAVAIAKSPASAWDHSLLYRTSNAYMVVGGVGGLVISAIGFYAKRNLKQQGE